MVFGITRQSRGESSILSSGVRKMKLNYNLIENIVAIMFAILFALYMFNIVLHR